MIDLLRKLIGNGGSRSSGEGRKDETRDIRIAACVLLLEMAGIDGEFDNAEREGILRILRDEYSLSDEDARDFAEAARKELEESIDLWRFTNAINEHYTEDEKIRVMELVWRIVYADGKLDRHEDYLIHKMANLLRLSHKQLIETKLRVLRGDSS